MISRSSIWGIEEVRGRLPIFNQNILARHLGEKKREGGTIIWSV